MTSERATDYGPILRVLGPAAAERWLARTRPAIALTADTDAHAHGPVVGQLHGLPSLPADVPWPVREGYGALTHLATIDCAALPVQKFDIGLPEDGTLLFFRWTFSDIDRYAEETGWTGDDSGCHQSRGTDRGAAMKLLHVPASVPTVTRLAPEGSEVEVATPMRLTTTYTSPLGWEETVRDFPIDDAHRTDLACAFDASVHTFGPHQVGGHPDGAGSSVVESLARFVCGTDAPEEVLRAEDDRWVMIASIYDYMDEARTYWMIQREHLTQGRFDDIYYEYQC
ncbi:DUF1963 domain-containing protein [Streptomyces sp. NPDC006475]|uniref:DUF1963 domain-containing protein n=1 Tax=Streptomyces sp. NPDC006475 TaxID=3155719 RepID=UPI0033AB719D